MGTERELPQAFCRQMEYWLGREWPELKLALESDRSYRGVRLHRVTSKDAENSNGTDNNPLNGGDETPPPSSSAYYAIENRLPIPQVLLPHLKQPVPWSRDGYYVAQDTDLGKTIYHESGAFYMQEPSAMAAVEALNPRPGEAILDLCAAPGGKTTAIASRMRGRGLLVANEIHPERVLILSQNCERTGSPAVVVNESPEQLSRVWEGQFDAILVDAPCSGEGMFRKEPLARGEWTEDSPTRCARRQREILSQAVRMVKPGGRLVYSTCTLNPVENEQVMAWAVENLPVQLEVLPDWAGWSAGRPEWANDMDAILGTRRLWPHIGPGEGHFVARLRVNSESNSNQVMAARHSRGHKTRRQTNSREQVSAWLSLAEQLVKELPETWQAPITQGNLLVGPLTSLVLTGLRVLRPGLPLAEVSGRVAVPHHALAMALDLSVPINTVDVSADDAVRFLAGEALPLSLNRGWHLVHHNGLPLGWGKAVDGRLNNNYPKGLRKTRLSYYI